MRQSGHFGNIEKRGLPAIGLVVLWSLMIASGASADLIVSNLAGGGDTDGTNFGGTGIYAQSFTTDARSYRLDDIILRVAKFTYIDGSSATGVEVKIWDSSPVGPLPNSVVGSFDIPALPEDYFDDTTFLPSAEILLAPLTTYWITTTHSSSMSGAFQFRATSEAAIGPGTIGPRFLLSHDGGLTWLTASSIEDMKLEVNGTVVPAPAAVVLGILGLGAAAARLRRKEGFR